MISSAEVVEFRGFKGVTRIQVKPLDPAKRKQRTIPIIDCTGIFSDDVEKRRQVAEEIREALTAHGTFYAAGHSVSKTLEDQLKHQIEEFFGQDLNTKMSLRHETATGGKRGYQFLREGREDEPERHDFREAYKVMVNAISENPSAPEKNPWPRELPEFRHTIERYAAAVEKYIVALLRTIALAIDAPEDFFTEAAGKSQGLCLLHYPPAKGTSDPGRAVHTDYSIITIIDQITPVPALEVLDEDGHWFWVPPVPGTFIINVGDFLERMSNKLFTSTIHRVRNRSTVDRYSAVYFYDANPEAMIDVAEACVNEDRPRMYERTRAGEWQKGLYLR